MSKLRVRHRINKLVRRPRLHQEGLVPRFYFIGYAHESISRVLSAKARYMQNIEGDSDESVKTVGSKANIKSSLDKSSKSTTRQTLKSSAKIQDANEGMEVDSSESVKTVKARAKVKSSLQVDKSGGKSATQQPLKSSAMLRDADDEMEVDLPESPVTGIK